MDVKNRVLNELVLTRLGSSLNISYSTKEPLNHQETKYRERGVFSFVAIIITITIPLGLAMYFFVTNISGMPRNDVFIPEAEFNLLSLTEMSDRIRFVRKSISQEIENIKALENEKQQFIKTSKGQIPSSNQNAKLSNYDEKISTSKDKLRKLKENLAVYLQVLKKEEQRLALSSPLYKDNLMNNEIIKYLARIRVLEKKLEEIPQLQNQLANKNTEISSLKIQIKNIKQELNTTLYQFTELNENGYVFDIVSPRKIILYINPIYRVEKGYKVYLLDPNGKQYGVAQIDRIEEDKVFANVLQSSREVKMLDFVLLQIQ